MSIRLFDAAAAHLPEITALENACFSDPWSENSFREAIENPLMTLRLATDEGNEILGYVLLSVVADESEILNIAVSPSHRREGIGRLLLQNALDEAILRGAENCYLEVRVSNESAIGLYTRFGFSPAGIRKNYYSKPKEDALLMCRPLKKEESYAAFSH